MTILHKKNNWLPPKSKKKKKKKKVLEIFRKKTAQGGDDLEIRKIFCVFTRLRLRTRSRHKCKDTQAAFGQHHITWDFHMGKGRVDMTSGNASL